jgi:hypothetical protein
MPEIAVNIEVYCAKCGEGLCNQTEATRTNGRGEPSFRVDPCERCLDASRDEGYSEGYEEGETTDE